MNKVLFVIITFCFVCNVGLAQQSLTCTDKTPEPEFSNDVRTILEKNKEDAKYMYLKNPSDADALIWFGRRMAYLGEYNEAIALYTKGINTIGDDPRFYRHRGHRYITLRCFDKAIHDFKKAAELCKGKPDETEPDGIPNAMNMPTSTLQTNIWYHLGLSYYLTENWQQAAIAFKECLGLSKNNDMYIASAYWLNMVYRRNGQKSSADSLVHSIDANLELIENHDYYKILLIYKGVADADELYKNLSGNENNISTSSSGYGLCMYYYFKKNNTKAKDLINRILRSSQITSFGYIAAEKETF